MPLEIEYKGPQFRIVLPDGHEGRDLQASAAMLLTGHLPAEMSRQKAFLPPPDAPKLMSPPTALPVAALPVSEEEAPYEEDDWTPPTPISINRLYRRTQIRRFLTWLALGAIALGVGGSLAWANQRGWLSFTQQSTAPAAPEEAAPAAPESLDSMARPSEKLPPMPVPAGAIPTNPQAGKNPPLEPPPALN